MEATSATTEGAAGGLPKKEKGGGAGKAVVIILLVLALGAGIAYLVWYFFYKGGGGSSCREDADCASGLRCVDSKCQTPPQAQCSVSADCAPGAVCDAGICVEGGGSFGHQCLSGGNCDAGLECAPTADGKGSCLSALGQYCSSNAACASASCVASHCAAKPQVACARDEECPKGTSCVQGACLKMEGGMGLSCKADGSCDPGLDCNRASDTCLLRLGAACSSDHLCASGICSGGSCLAVRPECTEDGECPPGEVCRGYVCAIPAGTHGAPCNPDGSCEPGQLCAGGICKAADGQACTLDLDCQSGVCSAGACAAQRPQCASDFDCAGDQSCLSGVCHKTFGGFGQACDRSSGCDVGYVCSRGNQCLLPNGGACATNADCAGGYCGSELKCGEKPSGPACSADAQCPADGYCDPTGTCLPRTADGHPCDAFTRCLEGSTCAGGVCAIAAPTPCSSGADCQDAPALLELQGDGTWKTELALLAGTKVPAVPANVIYESAAQAFALASPKSFLRLSGGAVSSPHPARFTIGSQAYNFLSATDGHITASPSQYPDFIQLFRSIWDPPSRAYFYSATPYGFNASDGLEISSREGGRLALYTAYNRTLAYTEPASFGAGAYVWNYASSLSSRVFTASHAKPLVLAGDFIALLDTSAPDHAIEVYSPEYDPANQVWGRRTDRVEPQAGAIAAYGVATDELGKVMAYAALASASLKFWVGGRAYSASPAPGSAVGESGNRLYLFSPRVR